MKNPELNNSLDNSFKFLTYSEENLQILRHEHYCMVFFRESPSKFFLNFKEERIAPNTLLFLNPGEVLLSNAKFCSRVYIIAFRGSYFNSSLEVILSRFSSKFYGDYFDIAKIRFNDNQAEIINTVFENLEMMYIEKELNIINFKGFLDTLLVECLSAKISGDFRKLIEFNHLLDVQNTINHKVEDYAKQLDIKPKQFLIYLNSIGVQGPKEVILKRILLEAKKLLIFTDYTASQVTYEVGFNDPTYFSRFFKRHTDLTPLEYREKHKDILEIK